MEVERVPVIELQLKGKPSQLNDEGLLGRVAIEGGNNSVCMKMAFCTGN